MKMIFKYFFASIFVGLCAVTYQAVFYHHNARSSDIVSLALKPHNQKNSNPSRSSRVAQLEKQALQDGDSHFVIPVTYEMMPGQIGHTPIKTSMAQTQALDKTQETVQSAKASDGQPFFARNSGSAQAEYPQMNDQSHYPKTYDMPVQHHPRTAETHPSRKNQDREKQSTSEKPQVFYDIKKNNETESSGVEPEKHKEHPYAQKSVKKDTPLKTQAENSKFKKSQDEQMEKQEVLQKKPSWLRRFFSWVPSGIIPVALQQAWNHLWSEKSETQNNAQAQQEQPQEDIFEEQDQPEQQNDNNTKNSDAPVFTERLVPNSPETSTPGSTPTPRSKPTPGSTSTPAQGLGQSPCAQTNLKPKGFTAASVSGTQAPKLQTSAQAIACAKPAANKPVAQSSAAQNTLPAMQNMTQSVRHAMVDPQVVQGLNIQATAGLSTASLQSDSLIQTTTKQTALSRKSPANGSMNMQAPTLQTSAPGVVFAKPVVNKPVAQSSAAQNTLPTMQNTTSNVTRKNLPADGTAQELGLAPQTVDTSSVLLSTPTVVPTLPINTVKVLHNVTRVLRWGLQAGLAANAMHQGCSVESIDYGKFPQGPSSQQADALLNNQSAVVTAQDTGMFARVQNAGTALANAAKSVKILP